jgi:hypothetical protein
MDAGSRYLHIVGPFYGFFGSVSRCISRHKAPAGWLAALGESGAIRDRHRRRVCGHAGERRRFVCLLRARRAALAAFGLPNAAAVAAGAWFGPVSAAMRVRKRESAKAPTGPSTLNQTA